MCWLCGRSRSSWSQRVAHKSTTGSLLFSLKLFVASQHLILPLILTAWRFSCVSWEKPLLLSSRLELQHFTLLTLSFQTSLQSYQTVEEQVATPPQKRKGLNTSHKTVPISCQLTCLQGCAVNLFNETMQVKNSSLKRRWGKGRSTENKKFYFFSFHRCYKSVEKSVAVFLPLLCCIVKKSSATTLKCFARATFSGTISAWEQ